MREIMTFKAGEKSQLALCCNAKEEILLNKKLKILESMKKQAENVLTLDQRILYNRFTLKLRRSELAHAKLLGKRELVKQLSLSLFPDLHAVVTDGSEKAVRVILQHAEVSRVVSAPCTTQTYLAPALVVKKCSCKGLQSKATERKNGQKCLAVEAINAQTGDQRRNALGAKRVSVSQGQTDFSQSVSFLEYKRPYTTSLRKHDKLPDMNDRYQEICEKIPSPQQDLALEATNSGLSSYCEGFVAKGLKEGCLEQKYKSSRCKRGHKPRPISRDLFLGLDNMQLGPDSRKNNQLAANSDDSSNSKVKLFIQKVTALKQEQGCPLQDYYSERLLEKLGRTCQANQGILMDTEQEQRKWNPVGPEANHRSITIKKLDRNFTRKESPLEIMIREYYNEILTKENLMERNWPNNNSYPLNTNENSRTFVSTLL